MLASGEETGGYEVFIQAGDEGVGPPPHTHDWDETFYVLSGEIEIGVGDRSAACGPGTIAHVPAGCAHWFRFKGQGEMLSITSRRGASLFYTDVARETAGAADVPTTVRVALSHGMSFPGGLGDPARRELLRRRRAAAPAPPAGARLTGYGQEALDPVPRNKRSLPTSATRGAACNPPRFPSTQRDARSRNHLGAP